MTSSTMNDALHGDSSSYTFRSLTFLDYTDDQFSTADNDSLGFVLGFCFLTVFSVAALVQAVLSTRHVIYGKHTLKVLLRWASFVFILENATLAALYQRQSMNSTWRDIMYALQATTAPSLLLSSFDVTYMIHKIRCINFCGLYDGQTKLRNPRRTMALKYFMRCVAVCLMVLSLLVNFGVLFEDDYPLAGRVGWSFLISEDLTTEEQVQVILHLTPMAVVTVSCLYFSLALWRYGTTFSMVVHSSPLNPWFSPFFGTLALGATQWFGERWFPLLSHVGIFVFLETLLLLLIEVNKDLQAEHELKEFLDGIGKQQQIRRKGAGASHAGKESTNGERRATSSERRQGETKDEAVHEEEEEKREETNDDDIEMEA